MRHLDAMLAQFDAYTASLRNEGPSSLYEPIQYAMSTGGKRVRGLLTLYGGELFGASLHDLYKPAYGIELLHNFTLVHDDIMDNAELRRGKPAVYIKYGIDSGILVGDNMSMMALQWSRGNLDPSHQAAIINCMVDTSIEICQGQQMDMDFEERDLVLESEYLQMITWKTAVLLGAALKVGATVAQASPEDIERIYRFGELIGIAFQLQDDYLDSFGDESFGKRIGGDILNTKKTILLIKSLESALSEQDRNYLLGKNEVTEEERIARVQQIMTDCGAKEYLKTLMLDYHRQALEQLDAISAKNSTQDLVHIADMITQRTT